MNGYAKSLIGSKLPDVPGGKLILPLLYLVPNNLTIPIFGDLAGRWLAVVLGAATILVGYEIGRRVQDHATGLGTAAIWAIMPISVWFGQESRAYALLHLAMALTLWSGLRLVQQGPTTRNRCFFCSSILLGLYTHYFFVFVVALGVSSLYLYRRQYQPPPRANPAGVHNAWTLPWTITVAAMIPWLLLLRSDFAIQADWPDQTGFDLKSFGYTYFSFLSGYCLGPSVPELHTLSTSAAVVSLLPWLIAGGTGVGLLIANAGSPWQRTRWLLPLLCAVPIVGWAGNLAGIGYQARYPAWCHLAFGLWFALLIQNSIRPMWTRLGIAILLSLSMIAIAQRRLDATYYNTDMATVAGYLDSHADLETEPIFVVSGYLAPVLDHYLRPEVTLLRLDRNCPPAERTAAFARLFHQHATPGTTFWLVYARSFHEDLQGEILKQALGSSDQQPVLNFAGGSLYRITRTD